MLLPYNLTPFDRLLHEDANADVWQKRLRVFFMEKNHDPVLTDEYYGHLLKNIPMMKHILQQGYLVDEYTGQLTFDEPGGVASFNLAYLVERNFRHFQYRKVFTMVGDYGAVNNQLKFCGIELVNSLMDKKLKTGAILSVIGNECYPYPMNLRTFKKYDTIIASNVFQTDETAYDNWNFLLDETTKGIEVFFSSNTFVFLQNYINYDKIERVENPHLIYQDRDFENEQYGYSNTIYRIK